jgi:hypothetical protein
MSINNCNAWQLLAAKHCPINIPSTHHHHPLPTAAAIVAVCPCHCPFGPSRGCSSSSTTHTHHHHHRRPSDTMSPPPTTLRRHVTTTNDPQTPRHHRQQPPDALDMRHVTRQDPTANINTRHIINTAMTTTMPLPSLRDMGPHMQCHCH